MRTVDVAAATHVERSEAYRILARLRVLGLFGIENDRGGTRGGRRFWRTATEIDGAALHAARHREAWARITAWARARRDRLRDALHHTRAGGLPPPRALVGPESVDADGLHRNRVAGSGPTLLSGLTAGGLLPALVDRFSRR